MMNFVRELKSYTIFRKGMRNTILLSLCDFSLASDENSLFLSMLVVFLEPLELCYKSLCDCGDPPKADRSFLDFMRQVSTFGLSFVRLDIRQEFDRHTDVMDVITNHLSNCK